MKKDFRVFLYVVWQYLNLPEPTLIQNDIGWYLQYGPKRKIIQAFRGVGKSWITVAYVLWRLYKDPQINILVVSASGKLADNFSTFCLQLINGMPELHHLIPRNGQRDSKIQFDVGPARESKDPSVKSLGITGMLTGSRADLIVPDDIETPNNSMTQQMRDKLATLVTEFDAILKPGGEVVYLGTPQTEDTIYNTLQTKGYVARVWTAEYPDIESMNRYGDRLAPIIRKQVEANPKIIGHTTEPLRFSDEDLMERKASFGRSGYQLQFMLDATLSDALRYPLKLSDLIVMDLNPTLAPDRIVWATGPELALNDLPMVGMTGDRYYRPMMVSKDNWLPYSGCVMTIDPSGRGKDEMGICVGKMCLGTIYCAELIGVQGGYELQNLELIANLAKKHNVNFIQIEDNFGDGMFAQLLRPVLGRIYPCTVEGIHHTGQKELRIIDTLEPVLNQHRLVMDKRIILVDHQDTQIRYGDKATQYQAFYQLTRITKTRGSLVHDDRIEALSMMVAYWVEHLSRDTQKAAVDHRNELLQKDLEKFIRAAQQTLTGRAEPEAELCWF